MENAIVPEIDFTYFVTNHIGAELILATSPHDLEGEGTLAGLGEIADLMVLPPTLTFQYHFNPRREISSLCRRRRQLFHFYSEDASDSLIGAVGPTTVDVDDSVGVAFQLGADIELSERWFLNADVKYIQVDTTGNP